MIINVRGTNGSGKSTLVRRVMDHFGEKKPLFTQSRKQPIAYVLSEPDDGSDRMLAVIGHYERECGGGCDTINNLREIFAIVRAAHDNGFDVLFEGVIVSGDFNNTFKLRQTDYPIHIVGLDRVPLETCVASINERRKAKGKGPLQSWKNVRSKFNSTKSTLNRFRDAGVPTFSGDRDAAYEEVLRLLNLAAQIEEAA